MLGEGGSEVGCEIFSSHSIFEADLELLGLATQRQVIHTPMHSITLEIEACMLACQTLAVGERLICCHCIIGSVITFYTYNHPCLARCRLCTLGAK